MMPDGFVADDAAGVGRVDETDVYVAGVFAAAAGEFGVIDASGCDADAAEFDFVRPGPYDEADSAH